MFRTPRRRVLFAAAAFLLVAGCATAQSIELSRVKRADVKVLPGSEGYVHPLTGVVSYSPQPWQNRPVLGIKIGNSSHERPQAGLDRADVVYEEIVEGGVTRFLALFSTNDAPRVGPIRSVRTVDPKLMQPVGGLFGYSGGVPPVISALRSTAGVADVGANVEGDAYRRDGNREMPYNLYTSTDQLWSGRGGSPPKPQFEFLKSDEDATAGGDQAANEVKLSFAGNGSTVRFTYDAEGGEYDRYVGDEAHTVEGEDDNVQLSFNNVIVQTVSVTAGSTVDTQGLRSSEIDVIGDGSAVLFRGGRAFRGEWDRPSGGDPTRFIASDGSALKLAPGTTLIELLPQGRDIFVS